MRPDRKRDRLPSLYIYASPPRAEMRAHAATTSLCLSSSLNVDGLLVIVAGEAPDRVQAGE